MTTRYKPTPTFDFLKYRRFFGMLSAILCLGALMVTFYPGPNFNIDFAGGTNVIATFSEPVSESDVRQAMAEIGINDATTLKLGGETGGDYIIQTRATTSISDEQRAKIADILLQTFGDGTEMTGDETSGDRFYLRLPLSAYGLEESEDSNPLLNDFISKIEGLQARIDEVLADAKIAGAAAEAWGNPSDRRFVVRVAGMQAVVEQALQDSFADTFVEIQRTETVGPRVGEQLRSDAMTAVVWAMLLILTYIAFRFNMRYAPGALISQVHDVLIVVGLIVVFRIEFSLTIVAALLTIVGYSLNDTIVNFDRIRENITNGDLERESLSELVNRSINECLSRSVLTSMTTIAALSAILVFGGPMIRSFALVMLMGVIVGTYSSMYISNPIMIWTSNELDKREAKRPPRPVRTDEPVL